MQMNNNCNYIVVSIPICTKEGRNSNNLWKSKSPFKIDWSSRECFAIFVWNVVQELLLQILSKSFRLLFPLAENIQSTQQMTYLQSIQEVIAESWRWCQGVLSQPAKTSLGQIKWQRSSLCFINRRCSFHPVFSAYDRSATELRWTVLYMKINVDIR